MLLLALSLINGAQAGGLDLLEVGGSWGTPGATNPTAAWWNPAGIAVGGGTQFLIEGAPTFATIEFDRTNPDYGPAADIDGDGVVDEYNYGGLDTLKTTAAVPFFGVSSDFGVDGLGIGAALAVPVARGGTEESIPGTGAFHLRDGNIQAINLILAGGYHIADKVAFGVSGSVVDSSWSAVTSVETVSTLSELIPDFHDQQFEDPNYTSVLDFQTLRDRKMTMGAGVYITPSDKVGISLAFKKGVKLVHEGDISLQLGCPPENADGSPSLPRLGVEILGLCNAKLKGTGEVGYSLPSRINSGIVFTPNDKVRLEAMGGWVGWSVFTDYDIRTTVKPEDIEDSANPKQAADLGSQERQWARDNKNTLWLGVDGKVQAHELVLVGGRVLFDKSAIPTENLSTNNFDTNLLALSGVVAVGPFAGMSIGTSFEQQILSSRTVTDSAYGVNLDPDLAKPDRYFYPSANGDYSGSITRIGISVMGSFGAGGDVE
ncbi:MAG: hypothetical protein GWP91_15245 [Rhodobacterales bacterium]|nr:hypothetical protein [Rhodobacterales bacterium]